MASTLTLRSKTVDGVYQEIWGTLICDFANRVPALRHLLDRSNLEFLCVPLSAHAFSLCP
jgi:hypothetical protein